MSDSIATWTKAWAEDNGVQLWFEPETTSTNAIAREDFGAHAKSRLAPILYLTSHQTSGRGRHSNTWTDAPGALLSSWSFPLSKPAQPILVPLVGLAIHRALSKVWPKRSFSIKAPNDIYLDDKKLAGLLIEAVETGQERRVIIGLGLNVHGSPASVPNAAFLESAGPVSQHEWNEFLKAVLLGLIKAVQSGQNSRLTTEDAAALREALNRRPGLEVEIQKVGPDGELHTNRGVVPWQSL